MLLEILVIIISLIIFLIIRMLSMEFYIIYYLVFSVCERVLGLSLLIIIVRYHGNELYYSFNIIKFKF